LRRTRAARLAAEWATDNALPESRGSDAFGARSKKNFTGT